MTRRPEPSQKLLVFGRSPVPGRVKTRMIPEIGAAAAASVYRQMLFDALDTATAVPEAGCELWLDTPSVDPELRTLARARGLTLAMQQGDDLGMRMHHALEQALKAANRAVLIGSDCPGMDTSYLQAAFRALRHHRAVIGPAMDGGYVLIGLDRPAPTLFSGLRWGSDRVLEQTRRRLRRLQWSWHELPSLQDVDHVSDLTAYPRLAALARPAPEEGV
jgi:hypothetical protein